jgi:chitin synthase
VSQTESEHDSRPGSDSNSYGDEKGLSSPTMPKMEVVEQEIISGSRKRWMFCVWMLTFWMPTPVIRRIVKSPRKDIGDAWREKLAINIIIWFSCLLAVFFMSEFLPNKHESI